MAQVAAVREQHLLHNRLTHSLKVGQIGRRLAQRLLNLENNFDGGIASDRYSLPDIVEAAGLAHDIGHPPFGHAVEGVLDEKLSAYGGFEGNAQSFRVITKLAVRADTYEGLDLTRATLNAILKYPRYRECTMHRTQTPWHDRSRGHKWGVYQSEKVDFIFTRQSTDSNDTQDSGCNGSCDQLRSAAAVLMDWADDISYVTHDVYDYFRAGLMPLHALDGDEIRFLEFAKRDTETRRDFIWDNFMTAYEEIKQEMPAGPWRDTRKDRVRLYKCMNALIARFMGAVKIESNSMVSVEPEEQYRAEVLKKLTFFHVIERPALSLAQEGQKKIIGQLFDELLRVHDAASPEGSQKWPVLLREIYKRMEKENGGNYQWADGERPSRAVCDYICLLTEDQAVDLYARMTGHSVSRGSIFGAWFD